MNEDAKRRHEYRKLRRKVGNEFFLGTGLVKDGPDIWTGAMIYYNNGVMFLGGMFTSEELRLLAEWMDADHTIQDEL